MGESLEWGKIKSFSPDVMVKGTCNNDCQWKVISLMSYLLCIKHICKLEFLKTEKKTRIFINTRAHGLSSKRLAVNSHSSLLYLYYLYPFLFLSVHILFPWIHEIPSTSVCYLKLIQHPLQCKSQLVFLYSFKF